MLIPSANCRHLALKDEVIEAVRDKRFNIIAVDSVEQAVAWLVSTPTRP